MNIDFKTIRAMSDGQRGAFQELCCQLARHDDARSAEQPRPFVSLRGDGGDGGVECYVELPNGKRAWQAKYVFEAPRLVQHAKQSFKTALKIHPDLQSFVLCFPFDPTGKTGRGEGDIQKLNDWRTWATDYSRKNDRDIKVEFWAASELRGRLLKYDRSGGMQLFFFNEQILTRQWFDDRLAQARATAGTRYTPELNVSTDLAKWFAAFGRTRAWADALPMRLELLQESLRNLRRNTGTRSGAKKRAGSSLAAKWPSDSRPRAATQASAIERAIANLQQPMDLGKKNYLELKGSLRSSANELRVIERELARNIDTKYGHGSADSRGWRQYMAAWQVSFPAANLDATRSVVTALDALLEWLDSPEFALAF